ncbi:MAG: hypothetical protein HC890_13415 [Chloroflexaceae bacterium]|nr:hypothetical protein [Chloroflexaceae bacterium]
MKKEFLKDLCLSRGSEEVRNFLSLHDENLTLEKVWQLMDSAWDSLDCDNTKLDLDKINKFYQHPVWILNALFIEQHDLSMQHRWSIAKWIDGNKDSIKHIIDYGGGMGVLAKTVASQNRNFCVDIYEPYPNEIALAYVTNNPEIRYINKLEKIIMIVLSAPMYSNM